MSAGGARAPRVEEAGGGRRWIASRGSIVLAALLLTLLNASKPLAVDDAVYYEYAVHISQHPQDPYGFEVFWGERPQPAFEVLAAPLLPYWWAGALRLFGDRPILWKLSLFPFALLLAVSLYHLLARFARGLEQPLLWLMVLSPAVLPSFNLMLDVPALALSLASLSLFISACHGGRWGWAASAGLLAGLAMQTKQTSITTVAALLAYGLVFARLRLALLAAAVAAAVFAGWELLMALQYGESHFLYARAVRAGSVSLSGIGLLGLGFLSLLGGLAAVAMPLGLFGLNAPRWLIAGTILLGSLAFGVIPFLPAEPLPQLHMSPRLGDAPPEQLVFTALGAGVLLVAIAVFRHLLGTRAPGERMPPRRGGSTSTCSAGCSSSCSAATRSGPSSRVGTSSASRRCSCWCAAGLRPRGFREVVTADSSAGWWRGASAWGSSSLQRTSPTPWLGEMLSGGLLVSSSRWAQIPNGRASGTWAIGAFSSTPSPWAWSRSFLEARASRRATGWSFPTAFRASRSGSRPAG